MLVMKSCEINLAIMIINITSNELSKAKCALQFTSIESLVGYPFLCVFYAVLYAGIYPEASLTQPNLLWIAGILGKLV